MSETTTLRSLGSKPPISIEQADGTVVDIPTESDTALIGEELEAAIVTLAAAKDDKAVAEDVIAFTTERIIKLREQLGDGNAMAVRGRWVRVNRSTQRNFNLVKLRKAIGARRFNQVTTPKIDTKEYDRLRSAGEITDKVDAEVVHVTPRKAWVAFTQDPRGEQ